MSETPAPFWNRKTLMLITGASQGIGQFWAVEFSKRLAKDSLVILWARSDKGLQVTKAKVLEANPSVTVQTLSVDLGQAPGSQFQQYVAQLDATQYALNLLVNNAGTIGDINKTTDAMSDDQEWSRYLSLNFISFATLTSTFVSHFKPSPSQETCILNVTSLAAVAPMPSLGFYCVGKAARESYLKVLAAENPKLNILNYSPGVVHTDMVKSVLSTPGHTDLKKGFSDIKEANRFVTLEATTLKVIEALEKRDYESGGRIDYYDRA